jgi:hypothetical protein
MGFHHWTLIGRLFDWNEQFLWFFIESRQDTWLGPPYSSCIGNNLELIGGIIIWKNMVNQCGCQKHGECTSVGLLVSVKPRENSLHTRQFIFLVFKIFSSSPMGQNIYIGQSCRHSDSYKFFRVQTMFEVVKGEALNGRIFNMNIWHKHGWEKTPRFYEMMQDTQIGQS